MATSSMHKPGWRSRRRSRLSLVERAVPRLGRLPAPSDGAKAACGGDGQTRKPAAPKGLFQTSTQAKFEAEAITPALNGDAGPEQTKSLFVEDHDLQPNTDLPEFEEISEPTADRSKGGRSLESAEGGAALSDAEPPAVAETEVTLPHRSLADDISSGGKHAKLPDAGSDEPLPAAVSAAPKAAAPKAAADVEARSLTEIDETNPRSEERSAPVTSPRLEIDWDHLVGNGFVDPRDRGRPLPRNMDEIIRALVRQALSDQSSWRDRVILVTSPKERVSKTTAAINFAFGLSTVASHHAVLVDVDTSGPSAIDRLGGGDRMGIAAALADENIDVGDLVIRTNLDRLTLVASGAAYEDTLDRFASRRMLQIMRYLTENPETILVIDAPPILISQEAAVLSVIAGQVVLAVEAGRTTADQIEHALQRIGERHNVSLVLNASNGNVGEEQPSATGWRESTMAQRRAPGANRRFSKAAAVAGAVALCLFATMPAGSTSTDSTLLALDPMAAARTEMQPERWSIEKQSAMVTMVPCHRGCR